MPLVPPVITAVLSVRSAIAVTGMCGATTAFVIDVSFGIVGPILAIRCRYHLVANILDTLLRHHQRTGRSCPICATAGAVPDAMATFRAARTRVDRRARGTRRIVAEYPQPNCLELALSVDSNSSQRIPGCCGQHGAWLRGGALAS